MGLLVKSKDEGVQLDERKNAEQTGIISGSVCVEEIRHLSPSPLELSEMGLSIIRLIYKQKRPYGKRWKPYMTKGTTPKQVAAWMNEGQAYNWGVVLGKPSGIFALDVDSEEAFDWVEQQGGFGPNPVSFTSGKSPGQWLYRLSTDLLTFTRFLPYSGLEVRGNRHQSVIPPSIHPDTGKEYSWQQAPQTFEDIPQAPAWLLIPP